MDDQPRYHLQVIDETAPGRPGGPSNARLHRRVFAHNVPRLIVACRLLGHRAVIDGVDSGRRRSRWVVCDRCGVRPDPQGSLDAETWPVGAPYTAAMTGRRPNRGEYEAAVRYGTAPRVSAEPGPWPTSPRGTIGVEVLALGGHSSVSAEISIGTPGSESVVDAHLHLGKLGAVYVGFEQFGQWLQRRLNPTGYNTRVVGVRLLDGQLWWDLWAKQYESSSSDPRWMRGTLSIDPRVWLLGRRRYFHADHDDPVETTIRCAHGDDHQVRLQLQHWCEGRTKRPARWGHRWSADVEIVGPSISTRSDNDWKDGLRGFSVELTARGVEHGSWVQEAADKAAAFVSTERARSIYHHTTGVPAS